MTGAGPALDVDTVDFAYGDLQVLFGVSLRVAHGEALALLGTNGAGKSTLLRVAAGLERPMSGSVSLHGDDITARPAEKVVRNGLVLVLGGKAVFRDMSVDENLEMQALTCGLSGREARARLEMVFDFFPRLSERLMQKAGSLSGGEQQQLALAKAVLLEPTVLCIDELSLGLAPVVVQELLEIVKRIHLSGTSILLVEQSLNIAAHLCERAVFMEKGAVRFEGRTTELLERDDIARAVFLGGGHSN